MALGTYYHKQHEAEVQESPNQPAKAQRLCHVAVIFKVENVAA